MGPFLCVGASACWHTYIIRFGRLTLQSLLEVLHLLLQLTDPLSDQSADWNEKERNIYNEELTHHIIRALHHIYLWPT